MSSKNKNLRNKEASIPLELLPNERILSKVKAMSKTGEKDWKDNHISPIEATKRINSGENYGFIAGQGTAGWKFIIFDIERKGVLPTEAEMLIDEHALLSWDSAHIGQNRLVKVTTKAYDILDSVPTGHNHLSDKPNDDFEIHTNGYCLGPGCQIDHSNCRSTKQACPGEGIGKYELVTKKEYASPIDEKTAQKLIDKLNIGTDYHSKKSTFKSNSKNIGSSPTNFSADLDSSGIQRVEKALNYLKEASKPAFNDLKERIEGKEGEKCQYTNNGFIDRSANEFVTLSDLYGVLKVFGGKNAVQSSDKLTHKELAYEYFSRCCKENPCTENGRQRKWLEMNSTYRINIIDHAVDKFDREKFYRWLHSEPDNRLRQPEKDGVYSDTTYDCVMTAVKILSSETRVQRQIKLREDRWHITIPDDIVEKVKTLRPPGRTPERDHETSLDKMTNPPNNIETAGSNKSQKRELPTRKEIVELARFIDRGHNKKATYQKALGKLVDQGRARLAYFPNYENSERYVYFDNYAFGLEEARYIKTDGEKQKPKEDGWVATVSDI